MHVALDITVHTQRAISNFPAALARTVGLGRAPALSVPAVTTVHRLRASAVDVKLVVLAALSVWAVSPAALSAWQGTTVHR